MVKANIPYRYRPTMVNVRTTTNKALMYFRDRWLEKYAPFKTRADAHQTARRILSLNAVAEGRDTDIEWALGAFAFDLRMTLSAQIGSHHPHNGDLWWISGNVSTLTHYLAKSMPHGYLRRLELIAISLNGAKNAYCGVSPESRLLVALRLYALYIHPILKDFAERKFLEESPITDDSLDRLIQWCYDDTNRKSPAIPMSSLR